MTSAGVPADEVDPVGVMTKLESVLNAAGIKLPGLRPDARGLVELGSVVPATATALTRELRGGLAREYETAEAVRQAAAAAGLRMQPPMVVRRRVHLGDIELDTAESLDDLLSPAGTSPADSADEPDRTADPEQVAARLIARLREVTGGGFLNATFFGRCPRCGGHELIELDSVTPDQALAFAHAVATAASEPAPAN
ncbi:hypothetical protein OHA98_38135 [Streptomyces sp. NBC_00654]|uniref:hypothetical protein n=1 Tax=Streptomyces sp. NBC_00654 TaxID=2975799 RepID=UPI0022589817|nr:hypothetical protein [Streptomyces sp. NBC_00654]MCX4970471.1 hypothetical protein [Streptomyces sp. NBC_00654]